MILRREVVTKLNKTHSLKKIFVFPLVIIIKLYQFVISPLTPPSCRYSPTCSQYALEALKKYGIIKGVSLTFKRIIKCHPWGGSGYDPIP